MLVNGFIIAILILELDKRLNGSFQLPSRVTVLQCYRILDRTLMVFVAHIHLYI